MVWTTAIEARACCELIDLGQSNWEPDLPPATSDAIVLAFEQHAADLGERIARLDQTMWENRVRFLVHNTLAWKAPLGELLWYMFFDSIHHRGQLSTYIRPMGGTVPSIYGPSGDSSGA
ncbi:MAG TPA: DinB family protein [Acidobacteriaceae bacterium]|nr:DinB family protein [Acidobacteriaceae bacterium]